MVTVQVDGESPVSPVTKDTEKLIDGALEAVFAREVWEKRTALIKDETGKVVFEQKDVEIPATWSESATTIVVNKYFRGKLGSPERETSVKQVIGRVVRTTALWGMKDGYFGRGILVQDVGPEEELLYFVDRLATMLVKQRFAFNSPVWFNLGFEEHPQVSACFIQSVDDRMGGIMDLARAEVMLFKQGSGTGSNLSTIRSSKEQLSAGGYASGPVSFMRGFDSFAGVTKSGGKTRRAAKMVILNVDHPDILDFIDCKAEEERKAHALVDAGWSPNFTEKGNAYDTLQFQNANHSVRVTDDFMSAVVDRRPFATHYVTTGEVCETYDAAVVFDRIADAAWVCGDPGLQFDTTVNNWHTCKSSGRINASNPCSEYKFLDDTACNLASLNLVKFHQADGSFDRDLFEEDSRVGITAMDIFVSNASYPTERIERGSHDFRTLGLGYANLGSLLMRKGFPYDSDAGRKYAARITALMTGYAYDQSISIAEVLSPFPEWKKNERSMDAVIHMHRDEAFKLAETNSVSQQDADDLDPREIWDRVSTRGRQHGFRNAQVSVLAPTGTIGFMMDCDTTGVEPLLGLVTYKRLVGGGVMKLSYPSVSAAFEALGYSQAQIDDINEHIEETGRLKDAPGFNPDHLPIFQTAFGDTNTISVNGHIDMMAAVQPFISGAISKTVNLPPTASKNDIRAAYLRAWQKGLKAIAVYRDGCKATQPVGASIDQKTGRKLRRGERRSLPATRPTTTHKFQVGTTKGYLKVGFYPDTFEIAEIWLDSSKMGSTISGFSDQFATAISFALQYGCPIEVLAKKFTGVSFEPSGFASVMNDSFHAKSIVDYIFQFLRRVYGSNGWRATEDQLLGRASVPPLEVPQGTPAMTGPQAAALDGFETEARQCDSCGFPEMRRTGSCYACPSCGITTGCS